MIFLTLTSFSLPIERKISRKKEQSEIYETYSSLSDEAVRN